MDDIYTNETLQFDLDNSFINFNEANLFEPNYIPDLNKDGIFEDKNNEHNFLLGQPATLIKKKEIKYKTDL